MFGDCYFAGAGLPRDSAEAVRLWSRAAALGSVSAQYSMGNAYLHGLHVPKDRARALELFNLAIAGGHSAAARRASFNAST
jgi:TPR repeat protein